MEKIKVSIITIAYNAEKTIAKTIESVLNQDYENLEYIIIEGKSTDHTLEVIKKYQNKKIHLISEVDNGISDAFNKGIKLATGDLIGLINADDSLLPHAISSLILACKDETDVIYGNTIVKDEINNLIIKKIATSPEQLKYELPFIHQSSFVRKNIYQKYGLYSEKYKICMDYEFFARIYQNRVNFQYVDTFVSVFSYGGTSCEHPFRTINENLSIARIYGLSSKDAIVYKFKAYFRNSLKIILLKLGIWKLLYRMIKRNSIYKEEV